MNLQNTIWQNYGFWFKVSLVAILFWVIISLTLSLVVYFAWPFYVRGFELMVFKFLTWFFILPAIGILGFINVIPFISGWLFEDVPDKSPHMAIGSPIVPKVQPTNSYKNVAAKLDEFYNDEDDGF